MKIIIVTLFLIALVSAGLTQTGGFNEDNSALLRQVKNDETFIRAQKLARDNYLKSHNENLGELVKVSHQVVSGVNYRLVFQAPSGLVQITVYCQPWTQTFQVLETKQYNQKQ